MNDEAPFFPHPKPLPPEEEGPSASAPKEQAEPEPAFKQIKPLIYIFIALILISNISAWFLLSDEKEKLPLNNNNAPSRRDRVVVTPKDGGVIIHERGGELIIPPGAVEKDAVISMVFVEEGPITDRYHLKPDGYSFVRPVTVAVPYKESGLKKGQTAHSIQLEAWGLQDGRKKIPYLVDSYNKKLRASLMQF